MAIFSKKSLKKLEKAHPELQKLFFEVIKHFDCTILHTHRTRAEQFELFKKGRTEINGKWEKTGKTVTQLDGYKKKSKHNYAPSLAIDVQPYPAPSGKMAEQEWYLFIGFVLGVAKMLKEQGKITHEIRSGGDWNSDRDLDDNNFNDLYHFEVVN